MTPRGRAIHVGAISQVLAVQASSIALSLETTGNRSACARPLLPLTSNPHPREVIDVANKDKGGSKSSKKQASQTLKEKRAAKKAKAAKKSTG